MQEESDEVHGQTMKIFELTGRTALVTGGSKGLGKAMARMFAEAGAGVIISSRHPEELEPALAEILAGTGRPGAWLAADMTRREDVDRLAREALQRFGRVDILVNNAGSNIPQPIDRIQDADWDRIVELNLTSCMRLTRALVPGMKERRWGRIIHISSVLGLGAKAARNAYAATKSGIIGLARASALDLGPYGITVNCLAPGPFLTDLPMNILSDQEKKEFADRTALGRWGEPHELAGAALLLASEAGSYITGQTLVVDGGLMAHTL
jgi:NAD(P)-dependent dehydrogenase (short-subunit alcohol dehydrogenase family)